MTEPETPRLLCAADFEPFVGREARFGDTGIVLVLDAVERPRGVPPPGFRAPFALIFSGLKGPSYLAEGPYACDFGDGAIFSIHVAPIHTPGQERQGYQAAFN